jgi:mannose-6-phosphate isomerase-like protein (cupin superfamily)
MDIQGKVWGSTSLLFCKNNVEVHRIYGKDGGFCSKHKHDHKYNMFFVENGSLSIEVWKDYNLVDKTIIGAGDSCTVAPGEYHKFTVLEEGTVAFEIYWVELSQSDISREIVGGKNEKSSSDTVAS